MNSSSLSLSENFRREGYIPLTRAAVKVVGIFAAPAVSSRMLTPKHASGMFPHRKFACLADIFF
jgi:hypothetical protein